MNLSHLVNRNALAPKRSSKFSNISTDNNKLWARNFKRVNLLWNPFSKRTPKFSQQLLQLIKLLRNYQRNFYICHLSKKLFSLNVSFQDAIFVYNLLFLEMVKVFCPLMPRICFDCFIFRKKDKFQLPCTYKSVCLFTSRAALSTWPEAWESHERMGNPGQFSHENLRLQA